MRKFDLFALGVRLEQYEKLGIAVGATEVEGAEIMKNAVQVIRSSLSWLPSVRIFLRSAAGSARAGVTASSAASAAAMAAFDMAIGMPFGVYSCGRV